MDSLTPHLAIEATASVDHYGVEDQSVFVTFFLVFREPFGQGLPPGRPGVIEINRNQGRGLPLHAKGRW